MKTAFVFRRSGERTQGQHFRKKSERKLIFGAWLIPLSQVGQYVV
jgi:hypothetical protein